MSQIFTDSEGREWEATGEHGKTDGSYIIQPVKQQPKYEVRYVEDTWAKGEDAIEIQLNHIPKDQAQLIKDWISEGMKYITGETHRHNGYIEAMDKARAALEDNNG